MPACPICGTENRQGARFCDSCGRSLVADERGHEVRKTVTVLFSDVTGSTALGEQLDPESLRRVMARYFDVARACLERHGGSVEKFIGDAVMAVFGVPTTHEDDALRALRAAAELRESAARLDDELEREYGVSLQVRVGVNTGEVVTGTEERLATGDAVNVAARLEQAAKPGEILVGERTHRLARDAIEVEAVEPLTLKGIADTVPAYRLLRVIEGAPAFERRLDAPLVGRRGELERLRDGFDRARAERRCRLATVLGSPGIGKSRLARELAVHLAADAVVLLGRCLSYGEGITYWPLLEIFRDAGAEEELTSALAAGAPEEVSWAVRKWCEDRAREQPLVLVFEDIHWAEPTLLDLIEHLTDWTRDAPLFVVCLARPELLDERPGWTSARPNADQLALEPLTDSDTDELIAGLLDGAKLPGDARERIRATAEGNPLFVEQLVAMFADDSDPGRVPPTIESVLAARLDALPDDERELIERASVVGLEFEWEALARLAADDRRPPGRLFAALVRKELIRRHEAIADTFYFRHILIRDAAYERLPKERRSDLHERYAGWLDGRGEEFEEIVGYHLEQAYRNLAELGSVSDRSRGLAERAAERLAASGRRANARGDARAAANLLERASELLPRTDTRRLSLLPSLGRAVRDAGQLDRAERVLSEAVELARAAGERGVTADAVVALTHLRLHRSPQSSVGQEELVRELELAIPVFEEIGDEAGLVRALTIGGMLRFWRGESAEALEELDRAAHFAWRIGDRGQWVAIVEYVLLITLHGPTPVGEALERIEEISSQRVANRRFEINVLRTRAQLEAMQGHFEISRDAIVQAKALAEDVGLDTVVAKVALQAGYVELLALDALAAEQELRTACETFERIGELGYLSSAAPQLANALAVQGRDAEALELTERWTPERLTVPEDADAQVGWRRVRAKLLARGGDVEEAERLAREATAIAADTDLLDLRAHAAADLAEVLRSAGRPKDAAGALEEAIRLFEQKGNVAAAALARAVLADTAVEV